jgi:hypothetical protein
VQGGRSPGEAAAAGDGEKCLNVIEFHKQSVSCIAVVQSMH